MKNCFIYGSFFLTTLLVWNTNFCIDIGSDSHPTRFNIQQNVNNGDRVAGFASLEGGLKLDGVFVTGIFDSFFPVSNSVDLRCGTLVLDRDFIFGDVAEFTSLGNVVGQCHTMEFSSTVTLVPNDPTIGCCESGCAASNLLDLTSECGEIKSFDWSYDDKFIVTGMGCVCSDRLKVYAFDGSDLTQRVVSTLGSEVVVYAVRWRPETYQFAVGREYSYYGNEFRIFEFDPEENTITEKSSINFNQHVWSVCWHPSGNYIAIGRSSNTYEVAVYSVNSSGVINATPVAYINLSPSNWVVNHNGLDWSPDGQYLVIGTDDYYSANELRVYQFNSGAGTLTLKASSSINATVYAVSWNKIHTGFIAVGTNKSGNKLLMYEYNFGSTLTQRSSFGNDVYTSPCVYSVDWNPGGTCLAVGSKLAYPSDKVEEFQTFEYDFDTNTFIPMTSIALSDEVEAVRWSNNGSYVGVGSQTQQLRVYGTQCDCGISGCVKFSDLHLFLNNDVTFRNCCITFDGESEIVGRGNCLTFCPTCSIQVDNNASLKLKDLQLKCVQDGTFYCLDNSSTVSFDNVTWYLDSNYSFTVGKIDIVKDLHFIGEGNTFTYRSSATSFIRELGRLIVGNAVTFRYDPFISSNSLFQLLSETSELQLRGGTLHATTAGLHLTKGILAFDNASSLSSDGTVESEALILGDDLKIQGLPAGTINIDQGLVLFGNI